MQHGPWWARCVSHSVIHVTYRVKTANREDERRAHRGPDRRRSPVSITSDATLLCSEGPGHRLGTMRDGCERQFDLRLEELLTSNLSTTTTTA